MNAQLPTQAKARINSSGTPAFGGLLQRKCACGNHTLAGSECEACRDKDEARLQRAAVNSEGVQKVPPIVHEVLRSPGQPLDPETRAFFEPRFGRDFSQVRVHTDAKAAQSARAVNAFAYTVGRHLVFREQQYALETNARQRLMAHELTHVVQQGGVASSEPGTMRIGSPNDTLEQQANGNAWNMVIEPRSINNQAHLKAGISLQRAEVDDNPAFCFPPGQTPLVDVSSIINGWTGSARARAERDALHITSAIYKELGTGTGVTHIEKLLGALPPSHVRHVRMGESRYSGTGLWPVDPLTKLGLAAAGKIFVAPVVNLCGVCVGTDKVGHFFQQGYEYFRLAHALRARIAGMSRQEQRRMYERLTSGFAQRLPVELGPISGAPTFEIELSDYSDLLTSAFVHEFGKWLEGFEHKLTDEDIRWIKSQSFIPWYYSEGVYGAGSTGVMSRADLQANRQGFAFYEDLWTNPNRIPNICDYVGQLWNERRELSSYVESFGTPRGPMSESGVAESP